MVSAEYIASFDRQCRLADLLLPYLGGTRELTTPLARRDALNYMIRHLPITMQQEMEQTKDKRSLFLGPMTGEDSEIRTAVWHQIQRFNLNIPGTAYRLAAASDRNLDNPDIWRWILARMPLLDEDMRILWSLDQEELFVFTAGNSAVVEPIDQKAWDRLVKKFRKSDLSAIQDHLDFLYQRGEDVTFQLES